MNRIVLALLLAVPACSFAQYSATAAAGLRAGAHNTVVDTGSTDDYVGCPAPSVTALAVNTQIWLKPGTPNTGAARLNFCGLGYADIKMANGEDPPTGVLRNIARYPLIWGGTYWQIAGLGVVMTVTPGAGLAASGPPDALIVEVDCTQTACKYLGTGAPGTITGALSGDFYQDQANGNAYLFYSGSWSKLAREDVKPKFAAGVNHGPVVNDITDPENGDSWYNLTLHKFRCHEGGSTKNCDTNTGTGGGGGGGGAVEYATYAVAQGLTAAGNFNSPPPVTAGTLAVGDVLEFAWHGYANMNVSGQTYSLSGRVGSTGLTSATSTGSITALTPLGFRVVVQCVVTAVGTSGGLACGGVSSYNLTSTTEENRAHVTAATPVAVDTTTDLTFQLVIVSMGDGTITQRFASRKIYKAAAVNTNIGTVSSLDSRTTTGDFAAPAALSANTLQVGDLVELSAHGYANMNTASQSYSIEGRVNATSIGAANASGALVNGNNYAWRADYRCVVTAIGASGTMECGGITSFNLSNSSEEHRVSSPAGTVSVDTTIPLTFRVSLTAVGDGTVSQRVAVRKVY